MRKSGRGTLWAALLLGSFALAACSNPVAVEHTISSGNHTISSGNLRQSRLQRPQTSADVGRRLDDASRVR
jgi:predicted small secreted protein